MRWIQTIVLQATAGKIAIFLLQMLTRQLGDVLPVQDRNWKLSVALMTWVQLKQLVLRVSLLKNLSKLLILMWLH